MTDSPTPQADAAPPVGRFRTAFERTFRSLRIRNYRLFFIGQLISMSGLWMQQIAQLALVVRLTDSGLALGIATGLHFAPMLVLGAWGGLLADRIDKRKLMVCSSTVLGVLALILGLLTVADAVELWMIYVLAFLAGLANAVDNPARRSFLIEMVGPDEVSNAVGLNSTLMSATRVIGPAIAALVIATIGVAACFFVNAGSYVAVLLALLAIDGSALHKVPAVARKGGQLREGFRYALSTPLVRLPLLMTAVVSLVAWNWQVTLPLFSTVTFGRGATSIAVFFALTSVGSLFGSLVTANREKVTTRYLIGTVFTFGVAVLATAAAPTYELAMVGLLFIGGTGSAFIAASQSVLQANTDGRMQGRVMALYSVVFLGSTPIGAPIIGVAVTLFGPRVGLALGGGTALLVGFSAMRGLRWLVGRPPATASTEEPDLVPEPGPVPARAVADQLTS